MLLKAQVNSFVLLKVPDNGCNVQVDLTYTYLYFIVLNTKNQGTSKNKHQTKSPLRKMLK